MISILNLLGRRELLFSSDVAKHEDELSAIVSVSKFLVLGGAGSIGQAVTKEIFKRGPRKLHVVDISENNLVELVRDMRWISGRSSTMHLSSQTASTIMFLTSVR